jgi:hypothetical protein
LVSTGPRRRRAEQDLARVGHAFEGEYLGDPRAEHDQVVVALAGQEVFEGVRVHADRHPQPRPRAGELDVADHPHDALHHVRRMARAPLVARSGVADQQRVATELDHVAAVVGGREQHGEDAHQRGDQVLGALAAAAGELVGQLGEARDVDEDQRALGAPVARRVRCAS